MTDLPLTSNLKEKLNWKNDIYKDDLKNGFIIFGSNMRYQKYQQQYPGGRINTTVD